MLRTLPRLADARTVAVPQPDGQARLVVYAVPAGPPPRLAELRAALRERVPAHLLPAELVILDVLPLTANGKLDHRALAVARTAAAAAASAIGGAVASVPRSALERRIAAEWDATLACGQPDIEANFFDLGGTSLLMAELQNRLESRLGLHIPMLTLFEYPAVRLLAEHLTSTGASTAGRLGRRHPVSPDATRRIAVRAQLRSEEL